MTEGIFTENGSAERAGYAYDDRGQLINDFTHRVAYDTKVEECDNHFLRLYEEGLANEHLSASYMYHFDDWIGSVGYAVRIDNSDGYHYMAAKDSNAEKRPCMGFTFEGILKPLPSTDGD